MKAKKSTMLSMAAVTLIAGAAVAAPPSTTGQASSMGKAVSRGASQAMGQASSMGKAASRGASEAMGQANSIGKAASQGASKAMGQANSMGKAASQGASKAMDQASSMGKAASRGASNAMGQANSMGKAASRGASKAMGQASSMGKAASRGVSNATGQAAGAAAALPSGKAVLYKTDLSGDNESPDVDTDATGNATAVLRGNHLEVSGNFAELSSPLQQVEGTSAHIHMHQQNGPKNGPIEFKLDVRANRYQRSGTFNGDFTLNNQQMQALKNGDLYVNVHTESHPRGELRGALKKGGGGFFGF